MKAATYKREQQCTKCGTNDRYVSNHNCVKCACTNRNYWNSIKGRKRIRVIGKRWHLKTKYDLCESDVKTMWINQNRKCGLCNKKLLLKKACVDHDHNSFAIRGILCRGCNVAIAIFDNVELYKLARHYLKRNV